MLLLHAVYGFRNTEVRLLRVDDIDWQEEIISLSRPKQRKSQLYPLLPEIGDAILQYLREVRPKTRRREVFLSLKQPYRPLTASATYSNVARRQRTLGLALPHYGPHSLRHACATRLLAEGFSLKEIGDHLGHSSTDATQIYAKVDLPALREVAELDLGNLVNFASRSMPDDAAPQNPSAGGQR
jgi:integrase